VQHEVTFEDLIDYTEGRLGSEAQARVAAHLATGCERCARDLAWVQRVLDLMATDELVDAPAPTVMRARELYRGRRAHRLGLAALLHRLWAPQRTRAAAVIALSVLLLLGGALAWGNATVVQAACLTGVQGQVEVRLPGSSVWQAAVPGMRLLPGSALRTALGGSALLAYADGSQSLLAGDGELEITSLSGPRWGGASKVSLTQTAGHTTHELAGRQSSVQVSAPSAVTRAENGATRYDVWVQGEETQVRAEHGQVTVQAGSDSARLNAGEEGWASGGHLVVATPTAELEGQPRADPPVEHAPFSTHTLTPTPQATSTFAPVGATEPAPEPTVTGHGNGHKPTEAPDAASGRTVTSRSDGHNDPTEAPRATAEPTAAQRGNGHNRPTRAPATWPTWAAAARHEPTAGPLATKSASSSPTAMPATATAQASAEEVSPSPTRKHDD